MDFIDDMPCIHDYVKKNQLESGTKSLEFFLHKDSGKVGLMSKGAFQTKGLHLLAQRNTAENAVLDD